MAVSLRQLLGEQRKCMDGRPRLPFDANDPLLPLALQGFRIATLTLEPHFVGRNFML